MTERSYIHGVSREEQQRLSELNRLTNNSFINYLRVKDKTSICDFGCGLGNLVNDIAGKFPSVMISGLEILREQFLKAKELNKGNKNVTLHNADIFNNGLPDDHFDLTYCRYLLEHVNDPVHAVKEMARVTRPGGRLAAQENDLYNVMFYPPIAGHDRLLDAL